MPCGTAVYDRPMQRLCHFQDTKYNANKDLTKNTYKYGGHPIPFIRHNSTSQNPLPSLQAIEREPQQWELEKLWVSLLSTVSISKKSKKHTKSDHDTIKRWWHSLIHSNSFLSSLRNQKCNIYSLKKWFTQNSEKRIYSLTNHLTIIYIQYNLNWKPFRAQFTFF